MSKQLNSVHSKTQSFLQTYNNNINDDDDDAAAAADDDDDDDDDDDNESLFLQKIKLHILCYKYPHVQNIHKFSKYLTCSLSFPSLCRVTPSKTKLLH